MTTDTLAHIGGIIVAVIVLACLALLFADRVRSRFHRSPQPDDGLPQRGDVGGGAPVHAPGDSQ